MTDVLRFTLQQASRAAAILKRETIALEKNMRISTGIALTKLDGTAKGGIAVSICSSLNIPLQYLGVGEKIDDLQIFDAEAFVDALFE